jgi:hypothetical protein
VASSIYSYSFAQSNSALQGEFSFSTGAATQTCVIRNMDFTAPTGDLSPLAGFRVDFTDETGEQTGAVWYMGPGNARSSRSYHWRGRATCLGGNEIQVTTLEAGWSWNISGYLLG